MCRVSTVATAALLAIAPGLSIHAGSGPAVLSVNAEVKPSAKFSLELNNAQLGISDADLAAGYVDLPAGSRLSISTGRFRPTVLLEFSPGMGPFKSVEVWADDTWQAAEKAGHATATVVTALSFRFSLIGKPSPRLYPLPLVLSVEL
jgi:hypothetical protein